MLNDKTYRFTTQDAVTQGDLLRPVYNSGLTWKKINGVGKIYTESQVTYAAASKTDVCYLPKTKKCILSYKGSTNKGQFVIGTISNDSISYGSEIDVNVALNILDIKCIYLKTVSTTDYFLLVYTDTNYYVYGMVCTLATTGTLILGTQKLIDDTESGYFISPVVVGSYIHIVFADNGYVRNTIVSLSGTNIVVGDNYVIGGGAYDTLTAVYDDRYDKVICAADSYFYVFDIKTLAFSSGTYQYHISSVVESKFIKDKVNNRIGIVYIADSRLYFQSFDFYEVTNFVDETPKSSVIQCIDTGGPTQLASVFDYINNKIVVTYRVDTVGYSTICDWIGYYIKVIKRVIIKNSDLTNISICLDDNSKDCLIAYKEVSSTYCKSNLIRSDDRGDALGIALVTISALSTLNSLIINKGVISSIFSGLSTGYYYYISDTGSLTTTNTGYRVGLALSSTNIIII